MAVQSLFEHIFDHPGKLYKEMVVRIELMAILGKNIIDIFRNLGFWPLIEILTFESMCYTECLSLRDGHAPP